MAHDSILPDSRTIRFKAIFRPIGRYFGNFLSVLYFNHSAHCWANKGPNGRSVSNILVCCVISLVFRYIPSISGQGGFGKTNLNLFKLQRTIKMTFLPGSFVTRFQSVPPHPGAGLSRLYFTCPSWVVRGRHCPNFWPSY